MKIRFTADAIFETEGRGRGRHFRTGKVYDLPDDQAKRWVRRNAAVALPVDDESEASEEEHVSPAPTTKTFIKDPPHPLVDGVNKTVRGKLPAERTHTADLAVDENPTPVIASSNPVAEVHDAPSTAPVSVVDGTDLPALEDSQAVPAPTDPAGIKAVVANPEVVTGPVSDTVASASLEVAPATVSTDSTSAAGRARRASGKTVGR